MEQNPIRAAQQHEEIDPRLMRRDHRNTFQKFSDQLSNPQFFFTLVSCFAVSFFVFPQYGEILALCLGWIFYHISKKEFRLPFRMPKSSNLLDFSELDPQTSLPKPAEGIGFFGNERNTQKELWFNNSDLRTHVLIFGSTGAGKALKKSELIHTPKGWVTNKDLKVGDMISTPSGFSKVIGIYPQGKLSLYSITFSDGRNIEVSGDHLWEVHSDIFEPNTSINNKKAKVLATSDIIPLLHNTELSIELSNEVEKPHVNLPISPYLYGYMLSNELIKEHIPISYLESSVQQRYDFIHGIFSKNITINLDNSISYTINNNNKAIHDILVKILWSLGAIVNTEKDKNKNEYKLTIYHKNISKLLLHSHLIANNDLKLSIVSIEKIKQKEDCQCIKIEDPRGLFITKDYIVTHNTESLLSLAYNALVQGSGLIYVDGKGENVLYTKVFAMARTMNREDDVLVINYMTGSRDVFGPQVKKGSNTLNPFSSGSAGALTELLVSLMDDSGQGGGDMWKGRAISLIAAIMMALTYMRDQKEILLDVDAIREYLILDNIIKLYKTRKDFPNHIRAGLRAYLVSLPGYQESAPKQSDTVTEQHGYLQMQFTRMLGSLSDTYGFIFKTNLGEVDFKDVVLNRRILVVLLPALEKSADELANLGKIIVACLKQMMASALGATIEGSYAEVVDTKPTNSDMPFLTVLDEFGYYAVKGSAVMPAQARSIGFSMIFAGQDLPAFEKASPEEAASIVANCNIKIFMKLEDPNKTYELFEKSVGEALQSNVGVMEMQNSGMATVFRAGTNASVEFRKRGNLLDLKDQEPGQAHIIFKSSVIRAQMFYASPPKPPYIRMNYFVRVEPPDISIINQLDNSLNSLIKHLSNEDNIKEIQEQLEVDSPHIDKLVSLFKSSNLPISEAAFSSLAILGEEVFNTYDENISSFKQHLEEDSSEDSNEISIFGKMTEDDENDEDNFDDDDDINVFLDEDESYSQMKDIEKFSGLDDSDAEAISERSIDDMKKISKYPNEAPSDKDADEIMDILNELSEFDFEKDSEN